MTVLQKIENLKFGKNVKIDNATLYKDKNELVINFLYPESTPLSVDEKQNIVDVVNSDFAGVCDVVVKFNKSCYDVDIIRQRIDEFIVLKYKVLKNEFKPQDIIIKLIENVASITFLCDEMRKHILDNRMFCAELKSYLESKFFIEFEILLEIAKDTPSMQNLLDSMPVADTGLADALQEEAILNKMEIELGECVYGKYFANNPIFIENLTIDEGEESVIAGVISEFSISNYTSKNKNDEVVEKKKYTFKLTDPSGAINVTIFPNDKNTKALDDLADGISVALGGKLSKFNDNVSFRASGLARCEILTKELKRIYRKVNPDYNFVRPQPVQETQQMDLFSMTQTAKSEYWNTHSSVVVFDLETTGFNAENCQIIEIGAVKVVDGSLVETFQTLVNPGVPIPEEITNLTHISNDMVVGAPTIEQVLPDFFKFAYGSVLSAYNISFDYSFIKHYGFKLRLLFDNEQIDTFKLARDKIPSLSNYKLGTVVNALNITLNNAHRALADAYATAKVFVKLI